MQSMGFNSYNTRAGAIPASATKAGLLSKDVGPLSCCAPEVVWLSLQLDAEVSKHASTAGSGRDTFILHSTDTCTPQTSFCQLSSVMQLAAMVHSNAELLPM